MRCIACNAELTDYESTRKDPLTGHFSDLCMDCIVSVRDTVRELDEPIVKEMCVNYEKGLDSDEEL